LPLAHRYTKPFSQAVRMRLRTQVTTVKVVSGVESSEKEWLVREPAVWVQRVRCWMPQVRN
jgi:hypothetical protein